MEEIVGNSSCQVTHQTGCTVNNSDLDSVTLKSYKVKDCGRNLGSNIFFLLPVLRLAITEVTKGKKGRILCNKYQVKLKIPNLLIFSY